MIPGRRLINYHELRQQVDLLGPEQTFRHLNEALEARHLHPTDFTIRELAEAFMGREWVDNLHPKRGRYQQASLLEADGTAVAYSHFGNITGQIFFNMIKEAYELPEFVFSKVIPTKGTTILDMEKIPGIADVGDEFSEIAEGDEYPNFGVSEDYQEIAAKRKRGGIVPVTKEAIFGDRTGVLLERCKKLGYWLGYNKEKRLIDVVIDENGGAVSATLGGHRYHWKGTSYATYQTSTPWDNVTTSNGLVDWTDVENAWLTLIGITDPYTGEPILQNPKHLVVTPQNLMTARRIMTATNVQTHSGGYATSGNLADTHAPSPLKAVMGDLEILSSQLLAARAATDTDWWMGDLSKAFAYFAAWDVLTEEAPVNSREAFQRDIVFQTKASEMGAAATIDPRVVQESRA